MADPVVRAHYVQRLARIGRIDERYAEQLVAQARRGRVHLVESGARSPLAPPGRAGRTATVSGRAPAIDGEAQLLRLLLASEECREAGLALDGDLFEDSGNRELYTAWRERPGLAAGLSGALDELDEEPRERAEALLSRVLPPHEPAELAAMVGEIATRLRERRQHARLRERTTEVAEELVAARRFAAASPATAEATAETSVSDGVSDGVSDDGNGSAPDAGGAGNAGRGDAAALAAELGELAERQRQLAREAAGGIRGTEGEIIEAGAARDGGGRS
jgi:hypothetical protein